VKAINRSRRRYTAPDPEKAEAGRPAARVAGLALGYDTALRAHAWGLWWVVIAVEGGVPAAAAYSLPEAEEVAAQHFARLFATHSSASDAARECFADVFTDNAVAALAAAIPLIEELNSTERPSERLRRATYDAMDTVEGWGRTAAQHHRANYLAMREREGVH
jgi:hypothetical protein